MKMLPKARNTDIVVQNSGKDLLIYDLVTHKAFHLNETSKVLFSACGGEMSWDELIDTHGFSDDLISLALDALKKENLIEGSYESSLKDVSRREAIRRVGLASMIALPVIMSLTAPSSASAQSAAAVCVQLGGACTFNNGAQAECCNTLRCAGFGQCVACSPTATQVSCVLTNFCCSGTSTPLPPANIFCNCN